MATYTRDALSAFAPTGALGVLTDEDWRMDANKVGDHEDLDCPKLAEDIRHHEGQIEIISHFMSLCTRYPDAYSEEFCSGLGARMDAEQEARREAEYLRKIYCMGKNRS